MFWFHCGNQKFRTQGAVSGCCIHPGTARRWRKAQTNCLGWTPRVYTSRIVQRCSKFMFLQYCLGFVKSGRFSFKSCCRSKKSEPKVQSDAKRLCLTRCFSSRPQQPGTTLTEKVYPTCWCNIWILTVLIFASLSDISVTMVDVQGWENMKQHPFVIYLGPL